MLRSDRRDDRHRTQNFPVSIKGVLLAEGRVVLLKNERDEWELPGGKLEKDETPEACLACEILEELNVRVEVGPLLDAWVYRISGSGDVLIVKYSCSSVDFAALECSEEHSALETFDVEALEDIVIPDGYRRAIRAWVELSGGVRA